MLYLLREKSGSCLEGMDVYRQSDHHRIGDIRRSAGRDPAILRVLPVRWSNQRGPGQISARVEWSVLPAGLRARRQRVSAAGGPASALPLDDL